jgi:hypothetical protein
MFEYKIIHTGIGLLEHDISYYAKEGWKLVSIVNSHKNFESEQFILFFEKEVKVVK